MNKVLNLSYRFFKLAQENPLTNEKSKVKSYLFSMSEVLMAGDIDSFLNKANLVISRGLEFSKEAQEGLDFCKTLVNNLAFLHKNINVLGLENVIVPLATIQRSLVAQSRASGTSLIKKQVSNFYKVYIVLDEIYDLKNPYSDHQRTNEWLRADYIDGPFAKLTNSFYELNKIAKECIEYIQSLVNENLLNLDKKLTKKEIRDYLSVVDRAGLESGQYDDYLLSKPTIKDLINSKFNEGVKQVPKRLQWQQENTARMLFPEMGLNNEHDWNKIVRNEDEADFRGVLNQFSLEELIRQYYNSRDRKSYMSRVKLTEILSRIEKIKKHISKQEKRFEHLKRPETSLAPLPKIRPPTVKHKIPSEMSAEERAEEFRLKSRKEIEEDLEKLNEPEELEFE